MCVQDRSQSIPLHSYGITEGALKNANVEKVVIIMGCANDSIIPNSGFRCFKYRYCEINRIFDLVEVGTMTNSSL
jgi:hypothetical protein